MPQTAGVASVLAGDYDAAAGRVSKPMQGDRHQVVAQLEPLEDPATDEGHYVSYTIGKDRTGGRQLGATVKVVQGWRSTDEPGLEIARFSHSDLQPNSDVVKQPIPPEGARKITDYKDLQLVVDFERGAP